MGSPKFGEGVLSLWGPDPGKAGVASGHQALGSPPMLSYFNS